MLMMTPAQKNGNVGDSQTLTLSLHVEHMTPSAADLVMSLDDVVKSNLMLSTDEDKAEDADDSAILTGSVAGGVLTSKSARPPTDTDALHWLAFAVASDHMFEHREI